VRTPPCHLSEDGNQYVVEAELPGVRKEDLDVRVSEGGRTLTIEGHTFRRSPTNPQPQGSITEHKEGEAPAKESKASQGTVATTGKKEVEKAGEQAAAGESTYQSTFSRSFTFPKPVDGSKITAKLDHGVLTLNL
ncbi:HSP20-like chaperone, partial [Calocera cornea HHB12733]